MIAEPIVGEPWRWPICRHNYDTKPDLTETEREALQSLGWDIRYPSQHALGRPEWVSIKRLHQPLQDARLALYTPGTRIHHRSSSDAVAVILQGCAVKGESFWGWDAATWLDIFGPDYKTFHERLPGWVDGRIRPYMYGIAYLLQCISPLHLPKWYNSLILARRVFNPHNVQAAIDPILSTMKEWGYVSARYDSDIPGLVCKLLLCNQSPYLHDLTADILEKLRFGDGLRRQSRAQLLGVHRALAALGHVTAPTQPSTYDSSRVLGVDPQWIFWVERWVATSTLAPHVRRANRCILFKVGRWLADKHPDIREPSQWTRQLCAEFLAAVQLLRVGDYTQRRSVLGKRQGKPLAPQTKAHHIMVLRVFFRDCQEWEWIPRRFNPAHTFVIPKSILALLGPAPRVIESGVWAKLLWAGLNLTAEDLPTSAGGQFYPFEMVYALATVWLFGGLRSDEIVRLRVGCTRPSVVVDDNNDSQTICYLDVPANKTGAALTKPVDPVVGKAINRWEAIRPKQPTLLDRRTSERVHFLFCFRARRVARAYLNESLIPLLCRKGGVPLEDVRGRITSHRARATIATQLYNAKEPMSLFELQSWLGHRTPQTTQYYARITPTKLAKAYTDADYFAHNVRTIDVLIDREAVNNDLSPDQPWQYYDLGHGYCTYTFFEQCPHRMACARCDFYLPKNSSQAHLLEAKENLQRMLASIPLTDDERKAVEDGQSALQQLLAKLASIPTPAGKTPLQLANGAQDMFVTLDSIQVHEGGDAHKLKDENEKPIDANPFPPSVLS